MDQHPEEYQKDLNPEFLAGQNYGLDGELYEEGAPTAYDYKDVRSLLPDWTSAELKELPIVPEGSRLQQGAAYFDLRHPERGEFKARGDMRAGQGSRLVPKDRVAYNLWNKLISSRFGS